MHGGVSGGGGGGRDHIKDPLEVGECVFLLRNIISKGYEKDVFSYFETIVPFEIWAQHTYVFKIIHGSNQGSSRGGRIFFPFRNICSKGHEKGANWM